MITQRQNFIGALPVRAFTFTELLAVVFGICLLGLLIRPTVANSGNVAQARRVVCLNNQRQLLLAFQSYAAANGERFPNQPFQSPDGPGTEPPLVFGWLDWTSSSHNTNAKFLADRRYSVLAPYLGSSAKVYKCPADVYLSTIQKSRGWTQRVRSVSLNIAVAQSQPLIRVPLDEYYLQAFKYSDLSSVPPSKQWIYIDEHPDSINDLHFFSPFGNGRKPFHWIDLPASYHQQAAGIGFADGHAEMHRWVDSVPLAKITTNASFRVPPVMDRVDATWMREHTAHKIADP